MLLVYTADHGSSGVFRHIFGAEPLRTRLRCPDAKSLLIFTPWPFLEYHPVSSWVFHGVSMEFPWSFHGVSGLVFENPSDVGFWSLRSSSLISSCSSACSSKSWKFKKHRKTKAIHTTGYNLGHSWIQWTLRILLRILRRMSSPLKCLCTKSLATSLEIHGVIRVI